MKRALPNLVGLSPSPYSWLMAMRMGKTVAAAAVWAMKWVEAAVTTRHPRRIMLVRSPTTPAFCTPAAV